MWADLVGIRSVLRPASGFLHSPCPPRLGDNPATLSALGAGTVKTILEDRKIRKVGQNIKYEWIVLSRYGIHLQGIDGDTMIAPTPQSNEHNHNLGETAQEYLDRSVTDTKEW